MTPRVRSDFNTVKCKTGEIRNERQDLCYVKMLISISDYESMSVQLMNLC